MASKAEPIDDDVPARKETWKDFVYNPDKKAFLGRTGLSWFKIGIFYCILYACLAGWFAGLLHAFYSTLDETAPTYYGVSSLLQDNPALGFRPMPIFDSTMIRFAQGKSGSYRPYMDHLDAFFRNYEYNADSLNCTDNVTSTAEKGCNIDINEYLTALDTPRDKGYGYLDGTPVVVLKMNKLFNFTPIAYDSYDSIVADLDTEKGERLDEDKLAFSPGNVGISCDGQNAVDKQNILKVDFEPKGGLDLKYFPYLNQKGYRSPVVLAKFTHVTKRVTIQVNCRLWAKNIDNTDEKQKRGSVHFELFIN